MITNLKSEKVLIRKLILSTIFLLLCSISCSHKSRINILALPEAEGRMKDDIYRKVGTYNPDKKTQILSDRLPNGIKRENISFSIDPYIIQKYNKFAYQFLTSAVKESEDENVVVSPLSLEVLLALIANSVDAPASKEILNYLGIPQLEDLNTMNRNWLLLTRRTEERFVFSLNNSIWSKEGIDLKESWRENLQLNYNVSYFPLSVNPIQSQKEINQWIKEKTMGLIPRFLKDPLEPTVMLALYNVCFFKGEWKEPFEQDYTKLLPFYTKKGPVDVETMRASILSKLYQSEKYKALDIDYSGRQFCMRLILPNKDIAMKDVIEELFTERVTAVNKGVFLYMPKFKTSYRIDNLKKMLKQTGVRRVFNDSSCFSSMTDRAGIFNDVEMSHETVVECDEKGTSATAVTGVNIAYGVIDKTEFEEFRVDRPFIFLILEKNSGAVMFAGIVRDPTDT